MTTNQLKKHLGCVVEVCWTDAHSLDPWTNVEELIDQLPLEGLPCRTYGVVIAANENGMMISGSINGAACVGASWFVPRGMITQVTTLIGKKGLDI